MQKQAEIIQMCKPQTSVNEQTNHKTHAEKIESIIKSSQNSEYAR